MSALPMPLVALKGAHIVDPNGWTVAKCYGDYAEEYARLIVGAVNSHAELLAALKGLLRFNEELCADINVSKHYPSAEKARAAIARAEEPTP